MCTSQGCFSVHAAWVEVFETIDSTVRVILPGNCRPAADGDDTDYEDSGGKQVDIPLLPMNWHRCIEAK